MQISLVGASGRIVWCIQCCLRIKEPLATWKNMKDKFPGMLFSLKSAYIVFRVDTPIINNLIFNLAILDLEGVE